jgi:hypothetical protein
VALDVRNINGYVGLVQQQRELENIAIEYR